MSRLPCMLAQEQEQYARMGPNTGLTYMVKNGFVIGKGLGEGVQKK